MSPCILNRCVCLFVLHLQLMTTEIVNSQLQPLPYDYIEISWNNKESSTNTCCWGFTFGFASHVGCLDNEILHGKVYVDFLLPYSCSIQSIPSIRRQILSVALHVSYSLEVVIICWLLGGHWTQTLIFLGVPSLMKRLLPVLTVCFSTNVLQNSKRIRKYVDYNVDIMTPWHKRLCCDPIQVNAMSCNCSLSELQKSVGR